MSRVTHSEPGLPMFIADVDRHSVPYSCDILVAECESVRSKVVSIETNQICLTIFSLAVDKRTKNNLYMH